MFEYLVQYICSSFFPDDAFGINSMLIRVQEEV